MHRALDDAGNITAEHVIILALVGTVAALALMSLGVPLLQLHRFQQAVVSLPFP